MIDSAELKWRGSSCLVYFRNLPDGYFDEAIYIENEYHRKFNNYLRRWGWWLQKYTLNKYECGYSDLTYIPTQSKKIKKKHLEYQYPFLPKEVLRKMPDIKTTDLLDYLEDPGDARFLKPGFMFFRRTKDNGLSVYEYYPLVGLDNPALSYKKQIVEIFKQHKENAEKYRYSGEHRGIGHSGVYMSCAEKNEDYADNMFESLDHQAQHKLHLFKKQVIELQKLGVPLAVMESILHQDDKLSILVITKKHEILLPDYNNMVIKMEPLVKAIFFLFLKHPEGIVFKHLPDYRYELIEIYKDLRPLGLNDRSLQSIEDVTNPLLNSINEKCARIRAAFLNKFDEHLAKHYYITGERGEAKKISLPRELVVWENNKK
ncbi:MAG: hypothetical protein J6W05_12050 [Prevotella sp.]|nr:hypothetical protein [Prevotella sp.]